MKHLSTVKRALALFLAVLLMAGTFCILPVSAGRTVTVRGEGVTTIYVSEVYEEAVGQLYNETSQGPDPYFERVRTGDRFTVRIHVEKTGDYHFCFSFGWVNATGNYTVRVDGGEPVQLVNTVSGKDWRAWVDSSDANIHLTAGEHLLEVTVNCDGPNIRALKIAPVGTDLTVKETGGDAKLFDEGMASAAIQITDSLATQFAMTVPFSHVDVSAASWNNNIGSLRLSLYPWAGSYSATLKGDPIAEKDFIDFADNSTIRLSLETPAEEGEYLLYMKNITNDSTEAVGIWAWNGSSQRGRTYVNNAVADQCARVSVHYTEDTENPYAPLSPVGTEGVEVEASATDLYTFGPLTPYAMEAHSRYGVQFNSAVPVGGVEVYVATVPLDGNSLTLSLYDWKENYATSVSASPAATVTLKDVPGDNWARLDCDLPAGEYLLEVSGGTKTMTVQVVETPTEGVNHYLHTAAAGVSLVCRLVGEKKLNPPSEPAAQDFITADASTWVGTDGLGRVLTTAEEAGGLREGKYVGIFYHTWHVGHAYNKLVNVTNLVAEYPEAVKDYNHPAWGDSTICFWNEPIYGYYNNGVDRYVLRKQAELLADAGVDVVFFDNTNGTENYMQAIFTLCEVWAEARADGVKTPQISYMLNMYGYEDTARQMIELYDKIYSKGLYQDLWFYWDDKPLVLGYPDKLRTMGRTDVYEFFSYRPIDPGYTTNRDLILESDVSDPVRFSPEGGFERYTHWKWISIYPQQQMKHKKTREVEEMCVCVAQNWSAKVGLTPMNAGDHVFGRGYTNEHGVNTSDEAVMAGLNIAEQWEYALEVDPTFIYITGWNEWVAGRYTEMWGEPNAIPDNALDGYSRDIEPSTGMLKDHFYNQMVSYIRRFKGVAATAPASAPVKDAAAIDWSAVSPVFRTYGGNTVTRDYDGYKGYHYDNTTGRNDFTEARVAYDAANLYFMVETAAPITPYTDPAWMRLFIDVVGVTETDANHWETFEFAVNRTSPTAHKAVLERSTGGWSWEKVAEVSYTVKDNRMVITVPRAALGIGEGDFTVNFKWSDNMQTEGDIMDVYTNGDAAPGGRFKYSFTTLGAVTETPETTPAETQTPATEPATPATSAPEGNTPTTPAETEEEKKGCRSSAALPATLALTATAALTLRREKGRKSKKK